MTQAVEACVTDLGGPGLAEDGEPTDPGSVNPGVSRAVYLPAAACGMSFGFTYVSTNGPMAVTCTTVRPRAMA